MTYKHVEVSKIVKHTAERIAQFSNAINTVPPEQHPALLVDGLPCNRELAQFAATIRKTNRYLKFGVTRNTKYTWTSDRYAELFVYMEGDTYAMARIGYGDYTVGGKADATRKFMVESRTIKNEKYKYNRPEYHMALTDTLDRAVKNVSKHMRRYSPLEAATISYDEVVNRLRSPAVIATADLYTSKRNVLDHAQLQTELFHLVDMGYSFLSTELQGMIVNWRNADKEHKEAVGRNKACYFITVRLQNDDMMCDVVRLHSYESIKLGIDPAVVYKMEELPEELAGRVAVLSMVEDNHYVDNVGLRVNSSTFWVHA
jgi:hypothetical protein